MEKRAIRDFEFEGEVWPYLDAWARQYNYQYMGITNNGRLYKRHFDYVNAPTMLFVSQDGAHVHLEAWVQVSWYARWIAPAEMTIESGGYVGNVARNVGRADVNMLIASLRQPLIP